MRFIITKREVVHFYAYVEAESQDEANDKAGKMATGEIDTDWKMFDNHVDDGVEVVTVEEAL